MEGWRVGIGSRIIAAADVADLTAKLCLDANYKVRSDVGVLLAEALSASNSIPARTALEQLAANADIAEAGSLPLCQDCGYVTVFAAVGRDIAFDGPFEAAVQAGIAGAFQEGHFRQSVVKDAFTGRAEPEKEEQAHLYVSLVPGNRLVIEVMPKGGGSDNASRLAMLRPTAGRDEIAEFVLGVVSQSGPKACPPLFVGVGIGGSFDSVALLAKKALLRDFRVPAYDEELRAFEKRLIDEINQLGIGPAGLGGETTALGVAVATDKTHIACLPVAVCLSCNQLRSATGEL